MTGNRPVKTPHQTIRTSRWFPAPDSSRTGFESGYSCGVSTPTTISRKHRAILWLAAFCIAVLNPVMMVRHRQKLGSWPNAGWPRSFTEKLMWRKLFDRNPSFVTVTDKLTARSYVAERAPVLPQARLLWVGDSARDIPDDVMAGPAILKTSNGSGVNFILKNGRPEREAIARATRHLVGPAGNRRREEWAYWPIHGRLLAEELLQLGGGGLPTDLKVYVAGGRACCIWASNKATDIFLTLRADGTPLPDPDPQAVLTWSEQLAELVRDAAAQALPLAAEFDMMRVDFLVTASGLLAGELTVYTAGGFEGWQNPEIAADIADAWDLRRSWFLRQPGTGMFALYAEALAAAEASRLGLQP